MTTNWRNEWPDWSKTLAETSSTETTPDAELKRAQSSAAAASRKASELERELKAARTELDLTRTELARAPDLAERLDRIERAHARVADRAAREDVAIDLAFSRRWSGAQLKAARQTAAAATDVESARTAFNDLTEAFGTAGNAQVRQLLNANKRSPADSGDSIGQHHSRGSWSTGSPRRRVAIRPSQRSTNWVTSPAGQSSCPATAVGGKERWECSSPDLGHRRLHSGGSDGAHGGARPRGPNAATVAGHKVKLPR